MVEQPLDAVCKRRFESCPCHYNMKNKTRKQLVVEEKYKLINQAAEDGFYLFEIGEIFKMTEGRVCQIIKSAKKVGKQKKQIAT